MTPLDPTLDPFELSAASISEADTDPVQASRIQSAERTDTSIAVLPSMKANQSSRFFERLLTAVIASVGLAVYAAVPSTSSHSNINQPHPSAYPNDKGVRLVQPPQSQPEQTTPYLISQSSKVASEVLEGIHLYGQSQTLTEK